MSDASTFTTDQPARGCDGCGLCCKVLRVDWLDKPAHRWCKHSVPAGCGIHGSHPDLCRAFYCVWIDDTSLGHEWRPDRTGFVLSRSASGKGLLVNVDIDKPEAWKQEPFYSSFKRWSAHSPNGEYVAVSVGERNYVVYPEEDVEICFLGPTASIQVGYLRQGNARQPHVMVKIGDGPIQQFHGKIYHG